MAPLLIHLAQSGSLSRSPVTRGYGSLSGGTVSSTISSNGINVTSGGTRNTLGGIDSDAPSGTSGGAGGSADLGYGPARGTPPGSIDCDAGNPTSNPSPEHYANKVC